MTPQETQLVNDLFDRLAKFEIAPRDAAAEHLIAKGLQRAPHAIYALVQTALVQDEALRRANARIEELQAQMTSAAAEEQPTGSFLDTMQGAVSSRAAARGSVPSVRPPGPGAQSQNLRPQDLQSENFQPQGSQPQPGFPPPPSSAHPGSAPFGSGASFLGNAASTAAGVIGGSVLLSSIRSMFGQHSGSQEPRRGFLGESTAPWSNKAEPGAAKSDPARVSGAEKADDKARDAENDGRVDSVADTDDTYDADDGEELDADDLDIEDPDDDSYDV